MGSISPVLANYNNSLIVFYSSRAVNEAKREAGQTMQQAFNRSNEHRLNDITTNYLGYYTDNGAYYYYHTETELNYEETIVSIAQQISLPLHYIISCTSNLSFLEIMKHSASAMQREYLDNIHPLTVSANKCNNSSFCLWYLSPLWNFSDSSNTTYALLGELNKWTAVSRQRFLSLTTNIERT
jgi:hypothetical protein